MTGCVFLLLKIWAERKKDMKQEKKRGITLAGNIIVDYVKMIDSYPGKLSLAPIREIKASLGGLVPNVGVDLAKLDPSLTVRAMGYVGDDADGRFALDNMKKYPNIDVSMVKTQGKTSFTDVMTVSKTGERTFFTYNGADGLLSAADFDFSRMQGLLHIGYILLLPGMDEPDAEHGTQMARVLFEAKRAGLSTSVDVVSEDGERFKEKVLPALRYTDYCTLNEFEAERTTGVALRKENGVLIEEHMGDALRALRKAGVKKWITIHCPEGAFGMDENDNEASAPSEQFEPGYIKSTVGAGDAFAAGILLSILDGTEYGYALHFANTVAGMSLSGWGASDGVGNAQEARQRLADRGILHGND